jgi:guanosine-3',5'-bis(diphosphate) 3'-pyrophosphohydrolase
METKLDAIRNFAGMAHEGQQRRYRPDPYIIHPEKVMEICAAYTSDTSIHYAALLHDVLEDTAITLDQMKLFLDSILEPEVAEQTVNIVVELTDVYTKSRFPKWNRYKRRSKEAQRLRQASAAAQTIKYADIIDNCKGISYDDADFGPRYLNECEQLLDHMKKGLPELYRLARTVVQEEKEKMKKVSVTVLQERK